MKQPVVRSLLPVESSLPQREMCLWLEMVSYTGTLILKYFCLPLDLTSYYSPDDGTDLYQLVTPDYANGRVLSFAVSLVGRMFSMILPPQVQLGSNVHYH